MADQYYFPATDYTGGSAANALDQYDGNDIPSGSIGIVVTSDRVEFFNLGEAGGYAESSPDTIVPDTNPGNKAWLRIKDRYLDGDVLYLDDDEDTYFSAATDDTLKLFFPTDTLAYQFEATALTLYNSSVIQGYINNVFFLKGRNAADDDYVDMFKINAADDIEVGADLDLNGADLIFDSDADMKLHAYSDDVLDFNIGGTRHITFNTTAILARGGISFIKRDNNDWITKGRNAADTDFIDVWKINTYDDIEAGADVNLAGQHLILDPDGDTYIDASTDDIIKFRFPTDTVYFRFKTDGFYLQEGAPIIHDTNNVWLLQGRNAADSSFVNMFKVNTNDDIAIGLDLQLNGNNLLLDADGDSYITESADDTIQAYTAGTLRMAWTDGNTYFYDGITLWVNNEWIVGRQAGGSSQNMFKVNTSDDIEVGADLDLNGNKLIVDADADTYMISPSDDVLDIYIAGTQSVTWNTTSMILRNSMNLIGNTNNDFFIAGRNAADSAFVDMFKVNASDEIEAGVSFKLENGTSINEFSIDDTLAGDSDNAVPTEQAVKAYVDTNTTSIGGKTVADLVEKDVATEWSAQQNFNEATITSSSNSVAWNLDTAQCAVHTLTENTTIASPTNMNAGGTYVLRVVQAAGVYTLSWNAAFKWGTGSAPAAPAADGDVIIVSFYSDGTNMYGTEVIREEA